MTISNPHTFAPRTTMRPDGLYWVEPTVDDIREHFACEHFVVEHLIEDEHWLTKVTFTSATGSPVTLKWTLDSLIHLRKPYILIDVLLSHGVRACLSPSPFATAAILNAVQRPDLVPGLEFQKGEMQ